MHAIPAVALAVVLGASLAHAASREIVAGPDSDYSLSIEKVAEYSFEKDGCGGIAWSGRAGVFYVLRDHAGDGKSKVYPVSFAINPATGAIVEHPIGTEFTPGSLGDAEDVALDPRTGALWISDEASPTIAEYGLDGVATGRTAPVPAVQRNYKRSNLSLEALTVSPDGLTMWTANEQALTCDGDSSSGNSTVSTAVRLTRFTRESAEADWESAGEWAYLCDPCSSVLISQLAQFSQCGLSGLCALPDGSLLTLEREVSTTTFGRCRVYRITTAALAAATEVSEIAALTETDAYEAVSKGSALLEFRGGGLEQIIVYEGIALGPILGDGTRAVFLVSDGGETKEKTVYGMTFRAVTVPRLCALKLTGLPDEGGPTVPPFLDWPADPDTQITALEVGERERRALRRRGRERDGLRRIGQPGHRSHDGVPARLRRRRPGREEGRVPLHGVHARDGAVHRRLRPQRQRDGPRRGRPRRRVGARHGRAPLLPGDPDPLIRGARTEASRRARFGGLAEIYPISPGDSLSAERPGRVECRLVGRRPRHRGTDPAATTQATRGTR